MKQYSTSFTKGREMAKQLVVTAVIACVASLFTEAYPPIQLISVGVSVLAMIATIYVVVKYCRCPHCGKTVFFGILKIEVCPKCRHSLITGNKIKRAK